ncbi:MAG: hypothetical protein ACTHJI_04200 [Leifsonia sp.]
MAVVGNNFEGGTDGVALTNINSGGASGTPFDAIFGTGAVYTSSSPIQGSMSMRVPVNTFGAGVYTLSNVSHVAAKIKFRATTVGTTDLHIIRLHGGSNVRYFSVHQNALGKLRVDDATGTTGVFTFANALTAGTVYRLEVYVVAGSTTSNGTIKVAYYLGNSTTPVETAYFANGSANVGAGITFNQLYGGKYSQTPEEWVFDELYYDTAASDFIGVTAGPPPTVSTPANQNVTASASVTASVTASSTSGTISSYAWSVIYSSTTSPTLTGASTNIVSFTATSDTTKGHLYILQCVVTDSNSLTTTITTEVRVPTTVDAAVLPGAGSNTVGSAWSNVGGAATAGDALADSSDTTYVESPALTTSAESTRYRLAPMVARNPLTINARSESDNGGTLTGKVRLYEGTTMRQEWTLATVTNAWADNALSVTTPGAISDWGNLYLEAVGTTP